MYRRFNATFSVHSLTHLAEDVLYYKAPLDVYSSFKFENFLQFLKNTVKSGNRCLEQIHNRYFEKLLSNIPFNFKNKVNSRFINKIDSDGKTYKYVYFNNCKYAINKPNNYIFNEKSRKVYEIKTLFNGNLDKISFS